MAKLAIIGAGPKAAALCAKAHCLKLAGRQISIQVFDPKRPGSSWSGDYGYTDGVQRLCTPAERDVGFPYSRGLLNSEGVQSLFGLFSWHAFLVASGGTGDSYRDWVDRGRKPPSHRLYADYVHWVITKARVRLTRGRVVRLGRNAGKWTVKSRHPLTGKESTGEDFDGVVVTGPGPAFPGFTRPDNARITDGVQFWNDPGGFIDLAEDREDPIVIAGSGGTAAAIAAWIARHNDPGRPILIIGNQAALFTRTESFFENALFSDDDAWSALNPVDRVGVSQRLNRGVVWSSVSDTLSNSTDVRFRPGRVLRATVTATTATAREELNVEVSNATGTFPIQASLVIDAAGFNPWWFTEILPANLRASTESSGSVSTEDQRRHLAAGMREDLSIAIGAPRLHAPMLSFTQGPGFASLMVLGAMSDRILQSYVEPVT